MPALTPALVLALATRWGAPVAPRQILALARAESALDPLAIHDDVTGRVYHPTTLTQALRIAAHCEMRGHDIDVGLLQINSGNFPWLHLSLAEAFNPVQSIRAGAQVLTAVSRYNTGSPVRGFENGYVQRILPMERAAPLREGGAVAQGAPHQPQTPSASNPHNDLIDALIQPQATRPVAMPLRSLTLASASQAAQRAKPQGSERHSALTDPLIHPRSASAALSKEASNG